MYHKRNTHDSSQSRNSLDQDTNLQNTAIEFRDGSNDDVKSFVIVNDIDLDEELSRAQKSNKNYFQVLSMNFYGKVRSHSFDNVDPKKSEKSPMSNKADAKPMMSRKGSGHSLLDKKTCASTPIKEEKPKTAMLSKKKASPVKGLDIVTEKFSKFSRALGSPKESSRKVSSPKAMTKKNPLIGNLTTKSSAKREPLFFFDSQQKSPVAKKIGDRQNKSPDNKTGQLNSQLAKKAGLSNLLKKSETMPENIEETVQTLSVEPSAIDIRPIEFDESEIEKKSGESSVKEKKSSTKESSRRGSDNQVNKEKVGLSSLSARILATPVKLQSKPALKEVVQKTGAEEKLTKLQLGDMHDLENEAEKKRQQGSGSVRNQVIKGKKGYERSPDTGKHSERTPVVANNAAFQGMKIILANKESLTPKVAKKAQSKEISTSVLESKKTSFDQNEDQGKNKKSSLGRLDMLNPSVKKVESVGQTRQVKTPKFDGVKQKSWKILDASDKIMRDQKRTQPTSPASGETRKVLNFFDKLASLKKREKI